MNAQLKTLQVIHIALVSGLLLVYFIVGDLATLEFFKIPKFDGITIIYLFVPLSAIFGGLIIYKQLLRNAPKKLEFDKKIAIYQQASIIRWAILEGAAFVLLFLKKDLILIGLFLILYMIFLKPSVEGMKRDYESVMR